MRPATVAVSEIFGPTLQGEGAMVGWRTLFVRTGGCDFRCTWCDSLYAVLPEHRHTWHAMTPEAIVTACEALSPPHETPWVTLSGGNPALLTHNGLVVDALQRAGYRVAIETQGTMAPTWLARVDHLTVSPKPPSSGMVMEPRAIPALALAVAEPLTRNASFWCFKFVIFDDVDARWAAAFVERHRLGDEPLYLSAGTPQGLPDAQTRDAILDRTRWLVEHSAKYPALAQARILPQLHVLLWGTQRGK